MQQDCKMVWSNCLQIVKEQIGEQAYKTWFAPIVPVKLDNTILTIQVPSQFFYEWLEEHYVEIIKLALDTALGKEGRLEYSVIVDKGDEKNSPYTISLPGSQSNQKQGAFKSPFELKAIDRVRQESQLNPNYSFDSYIEGDCNRLARSAGYAVAKKPGSTSFNPLMFYGGVGLGKTHLVQAIGNDIKKNLPEKFVLYVTSENFTNQFIEALKNNNVQDFTNFYLQVDVLLIDDVQFLAGKEKTQEIFFHVFNHLHQLGKQIIMTSDRPPRDLMGLQERLLSRFKWGLTADLQQPDYETRMAIIKRKMQADGIEIPENVVEYIAYSVDTNVRELEGVIISLIAHASLNRREIDLELAKQTLKNIVQNIETEVGIDYIQKAVSEYFDVAIDDMKAKTRKKEIVTARQVAMYLSKQYTTHTLKSIGLYFGKRDHTTVLHAVKTVEDLMDVDVNFRGSVEGMKKKLKMSKINFTR